MKAPATYDEISAALDYDAATGHFTWKPRPDTGRGAKVFNKRFANTRAGWLNSLGYIELEFKGKCYKAHRLAWFLTHGEWLDLIDHINGDRADNRLSNLRSATLEQNQWNSQKNQNNSSGYKGVFKNGKGWTVRISYQGKLYNFGTYSTAEEAHLVQIREAKALHGAFARSV